MYRHKYGGGLRKPPHRVDSDKPRSHCEDQRHSTHVDDAWSERGAWTRVDAVDAPVDARSEKAPIESVTTIYRGHGLVLVLF